MSWDSEAIMFTQSVDGLAMKQKKVLKFKGIGNRASDTGNPVFLPLERTGILTNPHFIATGTYDQTAL
ncbi:MAG: hypothetical protein FWC43_07530 [Planctomycetaceae bacterium]|nr:hypothetical protein [Planctomycetaceae bacterium]